MTAERSCVGGLTWLWFVSLCFSLLAGPVLAQSGPTKIEVRRQLALQLTQAGNHARAIVEYEKVLASDPKDAEAIRGYTRSLMALGRLEDARRQIEPLASDPARRVLDDRINLGVLYTRMGKVKEARDQAESVAQTPDMKPRERFDLAGLWTDAGVPQKARAILVTLPPSLTDTTEGLELRASVASALGDTAEAARLNKLLGRREDASGGSTPWDRVDALVRAGRRDEAFALAMKLLSTGRPTAAELSVGIELAIAREELRLAESLLARIPASDLSLDAELARAMVLTARGRLLKAEEVLQRAYDRHRRDPRAHVALVTCIVDQGDYERGLRVLKSGPNRTPSIEDLKLMVRIYRGLGRWEKAEATAMTMIRMVGQDGPPVLDLATFLIDQQMGRPAIRLLELNPLPAFRVHRAILLAQAHFVNQDGEDEVMRALEPAYDARDLGIDLVIRLANLLISMGREKGALRVLDECRVESLPPQALVLKAHAMFQIAGYRPPSLGIAGRLERSVPDFSAAMLMDLANLFFDLHADEKALDLVERVPLEPPWRFSSRTLKARILYLRLGRIAEGRKLMDELIAQPSLDLVQNFFLAGVMLDAHELRRADQLLAKLRPIEAHVFRHQLLVAQIELRGGGERKTARKRLMKLRSTAVRDPMDRIDLAEAFLEVPERRIALNLLETVETTTWLFHRQRTVIAQALVQMNRFEAAEQILNQLRRRFESIPDRRAGVVELAIVLKHLELARELYKEMPEWWLESFEGRRLTMTLEFAEGQYQRIVDEIGRMYKLRPLDPQPIFVEGQCWLGLKEYARALAVFDTLLVCDATRDDWVTGRGQALRGLSRPLEALPIHLNLANRYMDAGELPPLSFLTEAAAALADAGRPKAAHELYLRAQELTPDDADVKKAMAGVLGQLDRPQEAISTFKQGMRLKPERSDRAALAGYLREVGSREKARSQYEAVLNRDPRDFDAKRGLAGILAEQNWTRRKAELLYEEILAAKPYDHDVRAAFAGALARDGFIAEADEQLRMVEAVKPDHPDARKVRSALDLLHRMPNDAERAYAHLELPDCNDPSRHLGLADVSATRGKGYLRDEISHVMKAKSMAPSRRSVTERMDRTFLPLFGFDFSGYSGSDDLTYNTVRMSVGRLLGDASEGQIDLVSRDVSMGTTSTSGVDVAIGGLWNFHPGWTLSGGAAAGELGTKSTDILPWTEFRYRSLDGPGGLVEYRHQRVDDSPMALIAGLKSDSYRAMIDHEAGHFRADAWYQLDAISDGNNRKLFVADLGFKPYALLSFDLQYQKRSADRSPVPFELYYAPLSYQAFIGGAEVTTPRWGPFDVTLGGNLRADEQDGQKGKGGAARFRLNREMGPLAKMYAGAEYLHSSMNRRFDVPTPYNQTSYQVGYNTRF